MILILSGLAFFMLVLSGTGLMLSLYLYARMEVDTYECGTYGEAEIWVAKHYGKFRRLLLKEGTVTILLVTGFIGVSFLIYSTFFA